MSWALDQKKEKHELDKFEIDYGKPPKGGWSSVVCELYVQNITISLEFWCDILGFEVAYQRPEERFAYLERNDGAQIMLYQPPECSSSEVKTDSSPQVLIQIFVDSLLPVLTEIQKNRWPLLSEPQDVWRRWGDRMGGKREIRLSDPDGHNLLIAEDIGEKLL